MDGGDIYYHLFLCTCEHMLVGSSRKLLQEADMMKAFFSSQKICHKKRFIGDVSCGLGFLCSGNNSLATKRKTCYSPVIFPYLFLGCGGICCFLLCEMLSTLRSFLCKGNLPRGISQEHLQKFTWFQKSRVQKCLV